MPKIGTIPSTFTFYTGRVRIQWTARPDGSGGAWVTTDHAGHEINRVEVEFTKPVPQIPGGRWS